MAAPFLRRATPLLSLRLRHQQLCSRFIYSNSSAPKDSVDPSSMDEDSPLKRSVHMLFRLFPNRSASSTVALSATYSPSHASRNSDGETSGDDKEDELLRDIDSIVLLAKEILHSDRYENGEPLTDEDEKAIVDKLLSYHPNYEEKIGSGLHAIMVDRHPQFRHTRCFFVVRTDGSWTDFSYRKCLKAYIKDKYPSEAERFIGAHFKHWRS